ncbi:MAG: protein kinase [Phycisphaerales bacterium]|nr:MAG: protein kinase [Phycisphaerales bacterium]
MSDDQFQRVEELFQAAVDLTPADRKAFLAERCEGDPALRADVEKLLANYERAMGDFMQASPVESLAAAEDEPPARIDAYELLRKLGEGGFGEVYLAEQSEPVRRQVAMKILKLGMDSRQIVARFEAERQAMALMEHPHIAKVFDAGTCERGRPYFAMEYVPGLPVTKFCDDQELDTQQRLRLFIQVCEAVQHAHQKGIIHRDIKPSNIMVGLIDGQAVPKIIDFGIAKALLQPLTDKTMFTVSGQLVGTPEYMSPEQAGTSGQNVDTRTDIYSLGVILYELLTGMLPFAAPAFRSKGIEEIQRIIREDEPVKPSARLSSLRSESGARARRTSRDAPEPPAGEQESDTSSIEVIAKHHRTDPRTLCRTLKGDLDWITMKAMEKERTRRYASASELAADIRRHLVHEPVLAGPPGASYRMAKFVRRNKAAVAFTSVIMLALVVGMIGTSWQAIRATRAEADARALAESEAEIRGVAQRDATRARANIWCLHWAFAAGSIVAEGGEDLTLSQTLDLAVERIDETFFGDPLGEASIRSTIGDAYRVIEEDDSAIAQLALAYELQKDLPGADPYELMRILANVGCIERDRGHGEEAVRWWTESLDVAVRFLQSEYPRIGQAVDDMRRSLFRDDPPSDQEVLAHVNAVRATSGDIMPLAVGYAYASIVVYLDERFGTSEGLRILIDETLKIWRQFPDKHSDTLLREVIRFPARPGDEERRVEIARELVELLLRTTIPTNQLGHSVAAGLLGEALVQRGRPEDREEAIQLLVASYRGVWGRPGPQSPFGARALGRLSGRSSRGMLMSHAEQRYLQHPAIWETLREGIEQEDDPALLDSVARAMIQYPGLEAEHYDIALEAAQRADDLAPNDSGIIRTLGTAQYRAGNYDEAVLTLTRADSLAVEAGRGSIPANWAIIAMAHHQLGDAEQAQTALQRARTLMTDPTASDEECHAFFREAEALLDGR